MIRETVEIYGDLVLWAVDNSPRQWKELHINMEMLQDGNEIANSWVIKWKKGLFGRTFQTDIPGRVKVEMLDLFRELHAQAVERGEAWTVCDFHAFPTGKYQVFYSYEAPPRLNGNLCSGA